jgi:protein-tyrosine phosphatase
MSASDQPAEDVPSGADPPPSPDASSALLIVDALADAPLSRFRAPERCAPLPDGIDQTGFSGLRCSGSAQFSSRGWSELRRQLGQGDPRQLHVVDLRQESHCFVGGSALSWYAARNWGCAGLSALQSAQLEQLRIRTLQLAGTAEVGTKDDVVARRRPRQLWKVGAAADEPAELGLAGRYLRLPVTDHAAPRAEVVGQFVRFVSALPQSAHVHLHCRGGKGRTATFLTMLDILANARRVSFEAIIARQAALGGYDLRRLPEEGSPKRPYLLERWQFLCRFYANARAAAPP